VASYRAAQIVALLDAAADLDRGSRVDGPACEPGCAVRDLIFTGLRISEFLNLRWRDVDLAGGCSCACCVAGART
jgi:integrase